MKRALDLAARAAGGVGPRPPVGAVVMKDERVAGSGYTLRDPRQHAEIVALEQAGAAARGATMYVTLEPCDHHGSTPPCTEAIIDAEIEKVVIALVDPNPKVNGKGVERLQAAGVAVEKNVSDTDSVAAQRLIEGFAHHLRTGRPLVTAKYAMSLDGKIATRTGDSQWITGEQARRRAHELRARSDAAMVGIGTLLADNPRLTARLGGEDVSEPRPRLRIVVDSGGRAPPSSRIFWEPGSVMLVHSARSEDAGPVIGYPDNVEKLEMPPGLGGVDMVALIDELGARGVTSLLVEGGGALLGTLMDLDLVDRVVAFIAPVIIGGVDAPGPVGGGGIETLARSAGLEDVRVESLGPDLVVSARLARGSSSGGDGH